MATGQVKWFNRTKGFGFITQGSQEDIFVHYSQIQEDGAESLQRGDKVEFELCRGPGGPHAANVQRLGESKDRPRYESR